LQLICWYGSAGRRAAYKKILGKDDAKQVRGKWMNLLTAFSSDERASCDNGGGKTTVSEQHLNSLNKQHTC